MSKGLHQCTSCGTNVDIDCSSCKLAELKSRKQPSSEQKDALQVTPEDDDYSISEEMTRKGNDHTILYLFLVALAIFALVVLFSKINPS